MFLLGTGAIIGIIIAVVVILLIILVINAYNTLVQLRNKVRNQLSQVDVQLKKRFDLIPNLVETAKDMQHMKKEFLVNLLRQEDYMLKHLKLAT